MSNGLYDPTTHQRFAHSSIRAGAQQKADLTLDNRAHLELAAGLPMPIGHQGTQQHVDGGQHDHHVPKRTLDARRVKEESG